MRLGVVVPRQLAAADGGALTGLAGRVEALGLDLLWLEADRERGLPDPIVAAGFLAGATSGLRIGVTVPVGDVHPLYTAEDAVVADLVLGGRFLLALRPDTGAGEGYAEAVEVVLRARAGRPFRHPGPRWPTPANLEENTFGREDRVRVTPVSAQVEPPLWIAGDVDVAMRFGLSPLAAGLEDGARIWPRVEERLGDRAVRLTRPAVVAAPTTGGRLDASTLVADLRAAQHAWGLDVAVLAMPAELVGDDLDRALDDLARRVRPRVQLDRLPDGLEDHWDQALVDRTVAMPNDR